MLCARSKTGTDKSAPVLTTNGSVPCAQTGMQMQLSPIHDPHGQGIVEKLHGTRDEEVEILVPWEGCDVECQTKVACGNCQPAKETKEMM